MMQLVLNLVSSVCIKRKKPWPKLSWIGQEQDGLYILDGKRISQLYIPSGKTKKKVSKLHGLMNDVCAMNVSQNGQFLCGALCDGKIFLWDRDNDKVQFITGLPKVFNDADKGSTKNRIFFSPCGNMMLLMLGFEKLFLWQKTENNDSDDFHNLIGTWSQVHHGGYCRPDQSNTEATVDGVFYSDQVVGRCGAFSYVFNKGTELAVTTLIVKSCDEKNVSSLSHDIPNQDGETICSEVVEKVKCSIKWKLMTRPLYTITPASRVVKGRHVYVSRYSPDGQMLAIVLNQKLAKNTRLLFCSTFHSTSRIVDMKCCGGSDLSCGRTWWVSDIAWTTDSLFLLGITRNGAIFITTKLGEPIKLITTGHGMDLGPSLFLSLHPRITVKSFQENIPPDNSEISSGSEKDTFHQKFSVAVHSSQPLLLCSDGYMVTIFHFNSQPDYTKVITDLTKNVSWFLSSEATLQEELEQTFGTVHGFTPFVAKFGKDEYSSPGSTLSETTSGFGLARDLEAGVISFGKTEGNKNSSLKIEEMNDRQRLLKAEYVLLQALGIGTSCGRHWSQNMTVTMNLLVHTWVKLFTVLIDDESNCGLSNGDALFHNILTFVQSCFEAFRWDIVYQHCLPWFTQFVHATVKCLVSSKKFGFREIIDVCIKVLRKAEEFLHEIYAWSAISSYTTVHFLGDSFLPSCDTPKNSALNSVNEANDPTSYVNLDCKLDQSWLTLYHYVCKMYKSNLKPERRQRPDEELVQKLCWIQEKLQTMNTSRNIITDNKTVSLFDQGYRMYLDGNYSQATDLLQRSFHENKDTKINTESNPLELNLTDTSERPLISRFGASLIEDDLSSKLFTDIDTLLSILSINLESYDLKAALTLVYSFIDTTCGVSLQGLLETDQALVPADEVKISSSSSLNVLQLSVFVKYPLAWVVDNRALPVVQHLARFMSCYFTNLPLVIPTPFHSALPPAKQSDKGKVHARPVKNLSQQTLTEVIGQQELESIWTADRTMELLLISGLIGEAAWFANCLGDWKIAFLLSLTEQFRQKNQSYVDKKSPYHALMPVYVPEPEQLMKERINTVLKLDGNLMETNVEGTREFFYDEHILRLETILEASVIAEVNLVPSIIKQLMVMLTKSISKLDWMVPQDLYLPAPPLYCPQPARNNEDVLDDETRKEISLRTEITMIVQKILAMYKASRCFLYCAQEYCKHAVRNWSDNEAIPNIINELITTEGFYIDTAEDEDSDHEGVIRSFQEFCSLMWLLDVRNELALASRQYSKLKQKLPVVESDEQSQDVINQCEVVLVWLQRLLPFSDFFNANDDILDGILTMFSELPLNHETVDLLARYFHSPSLSVHTTDKLNRITRKMRNKGEGLEKNESLTVRFQQQCEKRRKETDKSSVQPLAKNFLEVIPEFCKTVEYELDFAFLRFLDTFLLITLAKSITSEDYKKTPLILPYKDKPSLETGSLEKIARRKVSRKSSFGIQRSQSFQDVGSIKKRPEASFHSPDDSDPNKLVNRSNSLTDLRNVKPSTFSKELQAFLPTLLWLKRWCLVEEHQKGSASKTYFAINTTSTAIRIQLPLKLVVNTVWLIENYYKEFTEAKGKCLRSKCSRVKKRKQSSKKETVQGKIKENVLNEEIKQTPDGELTSGDKLEKKKKTMVDEVGELRNLESRKAIRERSRAADVGEQNEQVGEVGQSERQGLVKRRTCGTAGNGCKTEDKVVESSGKSESQLGEKERRRRKRSAKDSKQTKFEPEDHLERTITEFAARDSLEEQSIYSKEKNEDETRGKIGDLTGVKVEFPKQRMGKRKEKNVDLLYSEKHKEDGGLSSQSNGEISVTFVESEKSISEPHENFEKPVLKQTDEQETLERNLYQPSSVEHIASTSKIKRQLFSSLSSVRSDGRSLESVDGHIPLLSFTDDSRNISDEKLSQIESATDLCGVFGIYSTAMGDDDDDVSLISDSLSVGQVPNDVAALMKVTANVNVDGSVAKKRDHKHRKTTKRQVYDESSSYESSEKARVKDEGSLLRRIIRSEMRKFIRAQQSETRSPSSTVRTENENFSDENCKGEASQTRDRVSQVKRKSNQAPPLSYRKNRNEKDDDFKHRSSQTPFTDSEVASDHTDRQAMNSDSSDRPSDQPSDHAGRQAVNTHGSDKPSDQPSDHAGRQAVNTHGSEKPLAHRERQAASSHGPENLSDHTGTQAMSSHSSEIRLAHTERQAVSNQGYGCQPATNENNASSSLRASAGHHVVQNPHQVLPSMVNQVQFPTISGWPFWYNPTFPSAPPTWLRPETANKENSDKGTQVEESDYGRQAKRPSKLYHSNNQDDVHNEDQIVNVAVQTDSPEIIETSTKHDRVNQESSHHQQPFLLSLNNQPNVRDENHIGENKSPHTKQASNACNDLEEFAQNHDVFPRSLYTEQDAMNPAKNGVSVSNDNPFTMPLLKFPSEVHSPAVQSLPFKIAWPDQMQSNEKVELPLLQLGDKQSTERRDLYFPLSSTEQFPPLLHFANQNNEVEDFNLVQVPENENDFLFLCLPETAVELTKFESHDRDTKNEKHSGKLQEDNESGEVGRISTARMKRRNQMVGHAPARETMKQTQSLSKQTFNDSPSSEQEGRNGTCIQSTERKATPGKDQSKKNSNRSKKTKSRRDKLKELNNIIRDLQRDITNDDDLVISEVSSILSPEIRYENFERNPEASKRGCQSKHGTTSTRNVSTGEKHNDHFDKIKQKPIPLTRLYKPPTLSARDIHTEIPSDVPVESKPVDVKVGTDIVLRFPVSVQTDAVILPPTVNEQPPSLQPRVLSVQRSEPRVQTKEFSIQSEPEVKTVTAASVMHDVAINTENVEEQGDRSNPMIQAIGLYPRVPADVYLDIQEIDQNSFGATSNQTDSGMHQTERFLSVVDITEEQKQAVKPNDDYRTSENEHFEEDLNTSDGREMSPTAEEMLVDNVTKGDHATLGVFSTMNSQRPNSFNDATLRGGSLQQISKSKISQQLHEMNEQFDAIEQLTSNMEQDLQRSNRLLRTIENLNKITDEKTEVEKKSVRTRKNTEEPTHNMAATERQFPNSQDVQHDNIGQKKETRNDLSQADKLSVLKTRPWINKPIEELTQFVSDDRTNEKNLDSGEDDNATDEDTSDTLLKNRPDGADSDIRNTEGYTHPTGDTQSRKSTLSICTTKSHADPEITSETTRSDRRLKLSLTPEDVLNVSREKLKDVLAGTTTPNVSSTRNRDVSSQKQQELREWMSKKRKLRHKQWTQELNEKRETEFKPFQSKTEREKAATSSKKLKISEKEREENRRTQKKEHVDERLLSAYDLINEMVTEHAPSGPALITQNSVRDSQRRAAKKTTRVNNRYKEKKVMNSKRPRGKKSLKASTEFYRTRIIQTGLTDFTSPAGSERKQSSDPPVYDYDIEQSARQFITRKSFENYQQKMSASFDFDRNISLRGNHHYVDPRVDELIEDVSLGGSIDLQHLDHLGSLLSEDSELRDLLSDVIPNKPNRDLLETRDDVLSRNSTIPKNVGNGLSVSRLVHSKRESLDKMDGKENNRQKNSEDVLSANEDVNLEMSDELAALLAEAKAAVGDDFSGTSEVGDIDWNEVDDVLQQPN